MKPKAYLLLILLVLLPTPLHAHPHNWIDLKTEFILDNKGHLKGLIQYWTFDTYYSAIKLSDITSEYKDQENGLKDMANDMAKNLRNYHYFSNLKIGNQSVDLPKPRHSSLVVAFKERQKKLVLTMNFLLKNTLPIKNEALSWRVFDPTYYIDMKHHNLSQILIKNKYESECSTRIQLPKPSNELINYASNLDRTKKDTKGLGAHFAETIFIQCS